MICKKKVSRILHDNYHITLVKNQPKTSHFLPIFTHTSEPWVRITYVESNTATF